MGEEEDIIDPDNWDDDGIISLISSTTNISLTKRQIFFIWYPAYSN